jgi:hypothetical protein
MGLAVVAPKFSFFKTNASAQMQVFSLSQHRQHRGKDSKINKLSPAKRRKLSTRQAHPRKRGRPKRRRTATN